MWSLLLHFFSLFSFLFTSLHFWTERQLLTGRNTAAWLLLGEMWSSLTERGTVAHKNSASTHVTSQQENIGTESQGESNVVTFFPAKRKKTKRRLSVRNSNLPSPPPSTKIAAVNNNVVLEQSPITDTTPTTNSDTTVTNNDTSDDYAMGTINEAIETSDHFVQLDNECNYVLRREKILNTLIDKDAGIPRECRAAFYDFFRGSKTSHRNNGSQATTFTIEESLQLIEIVLNKEVGHLQQQHAKDILDVENRAFELKEKLKLKVKQSFMDMVSERDEIKHAANREVTKLLLEVEVLKKRLRTSDVKYQKEHSELQEKVRDCTACLESETSKNKELISERERLNNKIEKITSTLHEKEQENSDIRAQCEEYAWRISDIEEKMSILRVDYECKAGKDADCISQLKCQLHEVNMLVDTKNSKLHESELTTANLRSDNEKLVDRAFLAEKKCEEYELDVQEERKKSSYLQQELSCSNEQNAVLVQRVHSLQDDLHKAKQENSAFANKVSKLEDDLSQVSLNLNNTVLSNEEELLALEKKIQLLETDLMCMCKEKDDCESRNNELQQSVEYAVAQFQEYAAVQGELTEQYESANKMLAKKLLMQEIINQGIKSQSGALSKELERQNKLHDAFQTQQRSKEVEYSRNVLSLENNISALQQELQESNTSVSELEIKFSTSDNVVIELKNDMSCLMEENSRISMSLEDISSRYHTEMGLLKLENCNLEGHVLDIEKKARTNVVALETNLTEANDRIASLNNDLSRLTEQGEDLRRDLGETVDNNKRQILSLQSTISENESEISSMKCEIETIQISNCTLHESLAVSQKEVMRLKSNIASLEEQLSRMTATLDETASSRAKQVADLESKICKLESDLSSSNEGLRISKEVETSLKCDMVASEKEVSDLKDKLAAAEAELSHVLISLEEVTASKCHEEAAMTNIICGLKLEISTSNEELQKSRDAVCILQDRLSCYEKEVEVRMNKEANLEGEVTRLSTYIDEVSDSKDNDILKLKTTVSNLENELVDAAKIAEEALNKSAAEAKTLQNIISGLEADVAHLKEQSATTITSLEGKISKSDGEICDLHDTISSLEAEISHLTITMEEEVAKHQAEVSTLESSNTSLQSANRCQAEELDEARIRTDAMVSELNGASNTIRELEIRLECCDLGALEMKSSLLSLQEKLEVTEREKDCTENQLRNKMQELAAIEAQCGDLVAELCGATGNVDALEFDIAKQKFLNSELNIKNEMLAEKITTVQNELQLSEKDNKMMQESLSTESKRNDQLHVELSQKSMKLEDTESRYASAFSYQEGELLKLESEVSLLTRKLKDTISSSDVAIQELQNENSCLVSKNAHDTVLLHETQSKVVELENDLTVSRTHADNLQTELSKLANTLDDTVSCNSIVRSNMGAEIAKLQTLLQEAHDKLHNSHTRISSLETKLSAAELDASSLRDTLIDKEKELSSLSENLDKTVSYSKTTVETLENDIVQLENVVSQSQLDLRNCRDQMNSAEADLNNSNSKISDLQSLLSTAESELAAKNLDLSAVEKINIGLLSELKKCQEDLHCAKSQVADLNSELISTKNNMSDLQSHLSEMRNDLVEQTTLYEDKVIARTTEVHDLKIVVSNLESELLSTKQSLEEGTVAHCKVVSDLECIISKLESDVQGHQNNLSSANDTVNVLKDELESSQKEVCDLTGKVFCLEAKVVELTQAMESTVDTCDEKVSNLENHICLLNSSNKQSEEALGVARNAITSLEHELSHSNGKIIHLQSVITELESKNNCLNMSLEENEAKNIGVVAKLESNNLMLKRQVNSFQEETKMSENVINSLRDDLAKADDDLSKAKVELSSVSSSLDEANIAHSKQVVLLQSSVCFLESELQTSKTITTTLQEKLDSQEKLFADTRAMLSSVRDELQEKDTFHDKEQVEESLIEDIKSIVKTLSQRLSFAEQETADARSIASKFQSDLCQSSHLLEETISKNSEVVCNLEGRISELQSDMKGKQDELLSTHANLVSLQSELSASQERVLELDATVMNLEKCIDTSEVEVSILKTDLSDALTKLAAAKAHEDELCGRIKVLEDDVLCLQSRSAATEQDLSVCIEQKKELEAAVAELEDSCMNLKCQLDRPIQHGADLQQQISALQRDLAKAEERVIDYEVSLMKSEAGKQSLMEQVGSLQKKVVDMDTAHAETVNSLEENIMCLKMKLEIFLSEISCLKDTLLKRDAELESVHRRCEDLESDLEHAYIESEHIQAENREQIEV